MDARLKPNNDDQRDASIQNTCRILGLDHYENALFVYLNKNECLGKPVIQLIEEDKKKTKTVRYHWPLHIYRIRKI